MEDFERDLQQALERRPAPPGLKARLLERRWREAQERRHHRMVVWQRLAATIVLCAVISGAWMWRNAEQRRKGEAARQQVFTALRIASHALNQMNEQLNARNRDEQ